MLLAGAVAALAWIGLTLREGVDARGNPFAADFIIFYGASRLALAGKASLAYASQTLLAVERQAVPGSHRLFLWSYPPTFQLVVWPLGLLPYLGALAAWTALGLSAYLATIRRITRDLRAWLPALAFPGVFINAAQGQTGFIITALTGCGLLWLDTRPLLAGVLLGLIVIKPQFGVLLPLLLIGTGRWKATAAAAVTACALAAVATQAFGWQAWRDFPPAAAMAARALVIGALPLYKNPSLFAALLGFGMAPGMALAIHGVSALAAAWLALRAWRGEASLEIKAGAAVLATLIVLPYSFDYDLVLLAIPIAVALKAVLDEPAPPGVRVALVLLAITPIFLAPLDQWLHTPIGPVALWCGLLAVLSLAPASAQPLT